MNKPATLLILFALLVTGCRKGPSDLKLPSLVSDNMVMQQKTEARIWGKANPDHTIIITPEWGKRIKARAGEDGNWLVVVATPEAGGPYTLKIESNDTIITIINVLIGEVWFCSGQSNMEMPVAGWPPADTVMHSARTITSASIPEIRLFKIERKVSGTPLDECSGTWEICSPETVSSFSATAFFFGKKLHRELQVPVGLIQAAWGGTPSEAWTSADALAGAGEFATQINAMKTAGPALEQYQEWLKGHKQIEVKPSGNDQWKDLDFGDAELASAGLDDSSWPEMELPGLFERTLIEFDGAVWFRHDFEPPAPMIGKDLVLELGPIDDMDRTWFNGELVGSTENAGLWQAARQYEIPGKLVREGKNTIAVRVLDTQGGGGIYGSPGSMNLKLKSGKTQPCSLEGNWKYMPAAELRGNRFYIFDFIRNDFSQMVRPLAIGPNSPSALYNGMVYPAVNYRIRGAIWYQGESNVGRAEQYEKIFPLMISNWREAWGIKDFPFYFVQIAPWIYAGLDADNSVYLREAQSRSLSVPKTGMVVTLDIATVMNIHPPFKLEVGERLANLALAYDYGKNVPTSGPVYKSMSVNGPVVKVSFSSAESGLVSKNGFIPEFEIAGSDGKYIHAVAKIVGNEVWVTSPRVNSPVSVRYCWRNGAVGTLFNKEGLPASQFKTGE